MNKFELASASWGQSDFSDFEVEIVVQASWDQLDFSWLEVKLAAKSTEILWLGKWRTVEHKTEKVNSQRQTWNPV